MNPDNNFFDQEYAGSDSTKVEKQDTSQIRKFLREPLPVAEIKQYGISKPTRVVIRGRVAKE
jgi:hypothetical protein